MKCKLAKGSKHLPQTFLNTIKMPKIHDRSPQKPCKNTYAQRKPSYSTNSELPVLRPINLQNKKKGNAVASPLGKTRTKQKDTLYKIQLNTDRPNFYAQNNLNDALMFRTPRTPTALENICPSFRNSLYAKQQTKFIGKRLTGLLPSLGKQTQHRNGRNIPWIIKSKKKSQHIADQMMQQISKISTIQQHQIDNFINQQSLQSLQNLQNLLRK